MKTKTSKITQPYKIFTYRIIIEPDTGGTFHGYVPALPGCHTWGKSIDETKKHLREAIHLYLASLKEDNEPIPQEEGLEFFETVSERDLSVARK